MGWSALFNIKGVKIAGNCVIATRSLVSKSIEKKGVIIGGNPAKILKENITWDRKRIYNNIYTIS